MSCSKLMQVVTMLLLRAAAERGAVGCSRRIPTCGENLLKQSGCKDEGEGGRSGCREGHVQAWAERAALARHRRPRPRRRPAKAQAHAEAMQAEAEATSREAETGRHSMSSMFGAGDPEPTSRSSPLRAPSPPPRAPSPPPRSPTPEVSDSQPPITKRRIPSSNPLKHFSIGLRISGRSAKTLRAGALSHSLPGEK